MGTTVCLGFNAGVIMNSLSQNLFSVLLAIAFLLGNFPGGTIAMAMSCSSYKLSGWDWVLSVVIPFFGIIKSVAC
jgi:hypothetical protein